MVFHTDIPVTPTAYAMKTGGDTKSMPGRNPVSWRLLGSMDAEDDWTTIAVETDNNHLPAENCAQVFFPLINYRAYQYYKLEVTAVRDGTKMQLSEFKLVGTPVFGTATFTMPAALTTIEESAFEDMTAMTSVDASHCATVRKWAFKGCTGLTRLRLSKDCAIDADAFTGCGTVYIFAPAGGSTEAYCNSHENCVFVGE